jgi:hypothetical protein
MADLTGAVKGDAKTDDTESHPIGSNAISETILCRQDVPDQAFGTHASGHPIQWTAALSR